MNKIISIVGMTGSGKTEVSEFLKKHGLAYVRFGDVTMEELKRRWLDVNEKNERMVREGLRKEHGMDAFARLNAGKLEKALEKGSVIADGLYSWEEWLFLREKFGEKMIVLAIASSPATRYQRLAERKIRPLAHEEAASRDKAEIENSHKAGPIAMADFTIINEGSLAELQKNTNAFWKKISGQT
ncbi:AAA family ATPase [Candidatus Woesearchaeota archaeon]|nr:AAA family ATPase [Candidatus Woesearchaeota archaeon]